MADDRTHLRRAVMPERSVEETVGEGNYVRIEEGLTDAMAHDEARRCLRCDVCIGCGLCMAACSEMGVEALRMADTPAGRLAYFDFLRPAERCIGCGACTQVCPTGAIRLEDRDGVRRTIITGTVVREQPLLVLQRVRRADADARAPGVRPPPPAGSHGGPPGSRALPVLCAPAGGSSGGRCMMQAREGKEARHGRARGRRVPRAGSPLLHSRDHAYPHRAGGHRVGGVARTPSRTPPCRPTGSWDGAASRGT